MECSCKGRAASFTVDYYISAQWVTGSTCTGNLEGNWRGTFCSSTCPALSPAFVRSNKFFLSPLWTFHALLGYFAVFLSRNQLRFAVFGMFNKPDISGKPQCLCACIGTVGPPCLEHIMFITGAVCACSSWAEGLTIPKTHSGFLWSTHRQWTELKFQGGQQPNWHNNPDGLLNIWISPPKLKKKKSPSWTQAKFPREEGKCVQRNPDVEHLGWM